MELFTVPRYVGDSDSRISSPESESQRLAQLVQEAHGRKRSFTAVCQSKDCDVRNAVSSDNDALTKPNKSKASIHQDLTSESKKKRRKKSVDVYAKTKATTSEPNQEVRDQVDNKVRTELPKASFSLNALGSEETLRENLQSSSELNIGDKITAIGGQLRKQSEGPKSIRRILPEWLSRPYLFSDDVQNNLLPVDELDCLEQELVKSLKRDGIQMFFPVQKVIVPEVLSCWEKGSPFGKGGFMPPDICVCAPTGSGKTLAYVLPIVQLLRPSIVQRLEALVIVPTKDLATQVWNVFCSHTKGTELRVGLANGVKSLKKECEQLGKISAIGYSSHVNILVATPGRLVEHISSSSGFTLQYLRFFVIDEADRLLAESYFGWLNKVYSAVYPPSATKNKEDFRLHYASSRFHFPLRTPFWSEEIHRPLQKLLFSATLTQNPEKLALLQFHRPKFFTVSKSVAETQETKNDDIEGMVSISHTPATLKESMYICNSGGKPLVLLYLLTEVGLNRVLCFTSSVESTHRLYLLVKHFGGVGVAEFSSSLTAGRRQTILRDFSNGKTPLIVCSDAMARGLDLLGVQYVVSYDPPVSSKTYIHRVGRTARAGKTGNAITLLHDNEMFHFKNLLKTLNKGKIAKHSIEDTALEPLKKRYEKALGKIKTELMSDKRKQRRK